MQLHHQNKTFILSFHATEKLLSFPVICLPETTGQTSTNQALISFSVSKYTSFQLSTAATKQYVSSLPFTHRKI